jgi:hypothetical protein
VVTMKSTVFKSNHVQRLKFASFSEEQATSIFGVKISRANSKLFDSKDAVGSSSETPVNLTILHDVTSKKILLLRIRVFNKTLLI